MRNTKFQTSYGRSSIEQTSKLAKATSWLFVLLIFVVTTPTALQAQNLRFENLKKAVNVSVGAAHINSATANLDNDSNRKAIVGSWLETVTFAGEGAPPPLKSLVTFGDDGAVLVMDQGHVNVAAGQVFSAGHGRWVARGNRSFGWTIVELISDLNGNLMGTLKVSGTYTVDESGNNYTGVFKAEITDIFGGVFSIDGTNEGHRIQVELLP
jgi:hypothetical protein